MSTFRGGPANGRTLMFHRGPLFLRVVKDGEEFDVLDMPYDEPKRGEEVFVYRRIGEARMAHLNYRGDPQGRQSGWYEFADYEFVEVPDEVRAAVRGRGAWQAWVLARPEAK